MPQKKKRKKIEITEGEDDIDDDFLGKSENNIKDEKRNEDDFSIVDDEEGNEKK